MATTTMIERNLGNIERLLRLLAGIAFGAWALTRPEMNGIEWFIVAVAIALVLNGIFSRCYLWFVLDINTCDRDSGDCPPGATCP